MDEIIEKDAKECWDHVFPLGYDENTILTFNYKEFIEFACEYTAKGYTTGKKHLIEDLKEELNRRLNLSINTKRAEGIKLAYFSLLEWLENESNRLPKENN
jgi:hypothetical protein